MTCPVEISEVFGLKLLVPIVTHASILTMPEGKVNLFGPKGISAHRSEYDYDEVVHAASLRAGQSDVPIAIP